MRVYLREYIREFIVLCLGVISCLCGISLRLNARDMSWPLNYSYSGERENTIWGIKEQAITEVGRSLFIFGLIIILLVVVKFLWHKNEQQEA